jgi:hypothetical protein
MIRFCLGLILAMGAAEAPHDAPITLIIIQATIGLIIAFFGARKLAKQEN